MNLFLSRQFRYNVRDSYFFSYSFILQLLNIQNIDNNRKYNYSELKREKKNLHVCMSCDFFCVTMIIIIYRIQEVRIFKCFEWENCPKFLFVSFIFFVIHHSIRCLLYHHFVVRPTHTDTHTHFLHTSILFFIVKHTYTHRERKNKISKWMRLFWIENKKKTKLKLLASNIQV